MRIKKAGDLEVGGSRADDYIKNQRSKYLDQWIPVAREGF